MKEYSVYLTLAFAVTAKNDEQAQERAEAVQDYLQNTISQGRNKTNRHWWPEQSDVNNLSVQSDG